MHSPLYCRIKKKHMVLAMEPNQYLVICFRVTSLGTELKETGLLQILANHSAQVECCNKGMGCHLQFVREISPRWQEI